MSKADCTRLFVFGDKDGTVRIRKGEDAVPVNSGVFLGEVRSNFQKDIRRGLPIMPSTLFELQCGAAYWAKLLDVNGFGNMVWHRLTIILSEDVGLGFIYAPAFVQEAYRYWLQLVGQTRGMGTSKSALVAEARHLLIRTVVAVSRLPKSRLINQLGVMATKALYDNDELRGVCNFSEFSTGSAQLNASLAHTLAKYNADSAKLPLCLLEQLIICVRQKRVFDGAHIVARIELGVALHKKESDERPANRHNLPFTMLNDTFEVLGKLTSYRAQRTVIDALKRWAVAEPKSRRLFLLHAMLTAMLSLPELNVLSTCVDLPRIDSFLSGAFGAVPSEASSPPGSLERPSNPPWASTGASAGHSIGWADVPAPPLLSEALIDALYHSEYVRNIDDWALDKHTSAGKRMGRGIVHFRDEGVKLVHRANIRDPFDAPAWEWYVSMEHALRSATPLEQRDLKPKRVKSNDIKVAIRARDSPLAIDQSLLGDLSSVHPSGPSVHPGGPSQPLVPPVPPVGTEPSKPVTLSASKRKVDPKEVASEAKRVAVMPSEPSEPAVPAAAMVPTVPTEPTVPAVTQSLIARPRIVDPKDVYVHPDTPLINVVTYEMYAQLPAGGKPRSWFGRLLSQTLDLNGDAAEPEHVFVKGPVRNPEQLLDQLGADRVRAVLGLPTTSARMLLYGTCRYIVMRDVTAHAKPYPGVKRLTAKNECMTILDHSSPRNVNMTVAEYIERRLPWSTALKAEFLLILLYRKALGCSDTNVRNIVMVAPCVETLQAPSTETPLAPQVPTEVQIYSVDENEIMQERHMAEMTTRNVRCLFAQRPSAVLCDLVRQWLDDAEVRALYVPRLQAWTQLAESDVASYIDHRDDAPSTFLRNIRRLAAELIPQSFVSM